MEMLVLLERFAGEPEVHGTPIKVETSATVVSGSSYHKQEEAEQEHVGPLIMAGITCQPAILVVMNDFAFVTFYFLTGVEFSTLEIF